MDRPPVPLPFRYDRERVRTGHYTDKYFLNSVTILNHLVSERYRFQGEAPATAAGRLGARDVLIGGIETEMHLFARRRPWSIACGVCHALQVLKECAGGASRSRRFVADRRLEVEAVPEGTRLRPFAPAMTIRGEYRLYGHLETVLLGILTRETKIATNIYHLLTASHGKPVFFFPARFDMPEAQMTDGYAYRVGVATYNDHTGRSVKPYVSTQAQAELWGGQASGTVPHAYLVCFLKDTAEAMVQFARVMPIVVRRIALVDVNNDCVGDSLRAASALFREYQRRHRAGDREGAERYRLYGVRVDTADHTVDVSVPNGGPGVTHQLVRKLRGALDEAPDHLGYRGDDREAAIGYFRSIKIVASGGFDEEKIRRFEKFRAPVDIYGVGSAFALGRNDYTADLMRVNLKGSWVTMAKTGRRPRKNLELRPVRFG